MWNNVQDASTKSLRRPFLTTAMSDPVYRYASSLLQNHFGSNDKPPVFIKLFLYPGELNVYDVYILHYLYSKGNSMVCKLQDTL